MEVPLFGYTDLLTSHSLLLWGFIRVDVFKTQVIDIDELKARITAAAESADMDMLQHTWQLSDYLLDVSVHREC